MNKSLGDDRHSFVAPAPAPFEWPPVVLDDDIVWLEPDPSSGAMQAPTVRPVSSMTPVLNAQVEAPVPAAIPVETRGARVAVARLPERGPLLKSRRTRKLALAAAAFAALSILTRLAVRQIDPAAIWQTLVQSPSVSESLDPVAVIPEQLVTPPEAPTPRRTTPPTHVRPRTQQPRVAHVVPREEQLSRVPPVPVLKNSQGDSAGSGTTSPRTSLSAGSVARQHPDGLSPIYAAGDAGVTEPVPIHVTLAHADAAGSSNPDVGVLAMVIDAQGAVESVRLISPNNRYRDRWWVSVAKTWRFRPALKDDQPVRFLKRFVIADTSLAADPQ